MITEKDLQDAIAECQGTRNPNANTCIKLASFYTILDHLERQEEKAHATGYSYDIAPTAESEYESESEFGKLVASVGRYKLFETIDELMETLRIMQPRLYEAFLRKLTAE